MDGGRPQSVWSAPRLEQTSFRLEVQSKALIKEKFTCHDKRTSEAEHLLYINPCTNLLDISRLPLIRRMPDKTAYKDRAVFLIPVIPHLNRVYFEKRSFS